MHEIVERVGLHAGRSHDALRELRLSQAAAARVGDQERLQQLYQEAGQWWEETAQAAFAEGQLDTFYWPRTHKPPCPWSFRHQEWALDMHTGERISDVSLRTAGSHASSCKWKRTQGACRDHCSLRPWSMQLPLPPSQSDCSLMNC